jgi:hypothetical protein
MKHVISGHRGAVAVSGTALLLALTGCGGSDDGGGYDGPGQRDAVKAMRTVKAVHAVGTMEWIADPARVDVRADSRGNCVGRISNRKRGAVRFVMRGDSMWLKPDAAYLKSEYLFNAGVTAEVEGSYLAETKGDRPSDIVKLCKPGTYAEQTDSVVKFSPGMTPKEQTEHAGVAVVPFVNEDPSTSRGAGMRIAAKGKPYPVTIKDPEGADVDLAFSAFDKPVVVQVPARGSVLTHDQLSDIQLKHM